MTGFAASREPAANHLARIRLVNKLLVSVEGNKFWLTYYLDVEKRRDGSICITRKETKIRQSELDHVFGGNKGAVCLCTPDFCAASSETLLAMLIKYAEIFGLREWTEGNMLAMVGRVCSGCGKMRFV